MNGKDAQESTIHTGTYTAVWLALLILLAATVLVARFQLLERYSVLGSLVIASIKTGLVLFFFMHLRYEGRFVKAMLTLTLAALTFLIGLTFIDVWYR
jgi:cytochrome c oxidase subunit IV